MIHAATRGLLILLLAAGAAAAWAEGAAQPEINLPFRDPDIATWVARFEQAEREVYVRRHEIVAATGVAPGMVVADIGAGTGLFTRLFAERVGPTGLVIAVDVSRPFIDHILRQSREQGLAQVGGVVNSQTDTGLAPASIDLAFVCDTYHHFEQPQAMLASIHRALKPGGRLVIVDFERIDGKSSRWVLEHVRAGREAVIREVEAAGFRFVDAPPLMRTNYLLRFTRLP